VYVEPTEATPAPEREQAPEPPARAPEDVN
jgi:hypothetical protein